MSIRLRCPNTGLAHPVSSTVEDSSVDLLRVGDHVEFHVEAGRTSMGVIRTADGGTYRVGNVRFLDDVDDERHTLVECELAD
ncbi:hypothetical protein [Deinococcus pimensis]|uniref:hypothetical protein n=1 Tax=Deinococcus pimensis TaxID=309888 RepID=UPI0004866D35|nr:hypothetical protein [Deinococcus pimensis]